MKVATWNLGYWQFVRHHSEAWAYLRDEIRPDLAFLQEIRPPELRQEEVLVFEETHHGWGTAVCARGIRLERVALGRYPGRLAAAQAQTSSGQTFWVASIHAPIVEARVFPHLARIFDEVETRLSSHPAIVGGDLNTARLAEEVWPGYGHGESGRASKSSAGGSIAIASFILRRFRLSSDQVKSMPSRMTISLSVSALRTELLRVE